MSESTASKIRVWASLIGGGIFLISQIYLFAFWKGGVDTKLEKYPDRNEINAVIERQVEKEVHNEVEKLKIELQAINKNLEEMKKDIREIRRDK